MANTQGKQSDQAIRQHLLRKNVVTACIEAVKNKDRTASQAAAIAARRNELRLPWKPV